MAVAKFLIFLTYITAVFFLPNGWWVLLGVLTNLVWMTAVSDKDLRLWRKIGRGTLKVLPFVVLTVVFNWWLDSWQAALWLGLKLVIVCNATMIYAAKITVTEVAEVLAKICAPLHVVGISQNEVKVLVSVALMMIPVLSKELKEMQQACKAKDATWNITTLKMVLRKTGWSLLGRVNQIEEGLLAKGIELE